MYKKWTDSVELTKKIATVIVVLFLWKRQLKTGAKNALVKYGPKLAWAQIL